LTGAPSHHVGGLVRGPEPIDKRKSIIWAGRFGIRQICWHRIRRFRDRRLHDRGSIAQSAPPGSSLLSPRNGRPLVRDRVRHGTRSSGLVAILVGHSSTIQKSSEILPQWGFRTPPNGRAAGSSISKLGMQLGLDMGGNILKEFWPDLDANSDESTPPKNRTESLDLLVATSCCPSIRGLIPSSPLPPSS
jgi:hypothetical protein